jgi:hypothetical protein
MRHLFDGNIRGRGTHRLVFVVLVPRDRHNALKLSGTVCPFFGAFRDSTPSQSHSGMREAELILASGGCCVIWENKMLAMYAMYNKVF